MTDYQRLIRTMTDCLDMTAANAAQLLEVTDRITEHTGFSDAEFYQWARWCTGNGFADVGRFVLGRSADFPGYGKIDQAIAAFNALLLKQPLESSD